MFSCRRNGTLGRTDRVDMHHIPVHSPPWQYASPTPLPGAPLSENRGRRARTAWPLPCLYHCCLFCSSPSAPPRPQPQPHPPHPHHPRSPPVPRVFAGRPRSSPRPRPWPCPPGTSSNPWHANTAVHTHTQTHISGAASPTTGLKTDEMSQERVE